MKQTTQKVLQIFVATVAIFASTFMLNTSTVFAANGCGSNSYYDNNHQQCMPCPAGPYGVSICPDTGIIFNENGELQTGNLIALSAFFACGAVVFLNSKYQLARFA